MAELGRELAQFRRKTMHAFGAWWVLAVFPLLFSVSLFRGPPVAKAFAVLLAAVGLAMIIRPTFLGRLELSVFEHGLRVVEWRRKLELRWDELTEVRSSNILVVSLVPSHNMGIFLRAEGGQKFRLLTRQAAGHAVVLKILEASAPALCARALRDVTRQGQASFGFIRVSREAIWVRNGRRWTASSIRHVDRVSVDRGRVQLWGGSDLVATTDRGWVQNLSALPLVLHELRMGAPTSVAVPPPTPPLLPGDRPIGRRKWPYVIVGAAACYALAAVVPARGSYSRKSENDGKLRAAFEAAAKVLPSLTRTPPTTPLVCPRVGSAEASVVAIFNDPDATYEGLSLGAAGLYSGFDKRESRWMWAPSLISEWQNHLLDPSRWTRQERLEPVDMSRVRFVAVSHILDAGGRVNIRGRQEDKARPAFDGDAVQKMGSVTVAVQVLDWPALTPRCQGQLMAGPKAMLLSEAALATTLLAACELGDSKTCAVAREAMRPAHADGTTQR